MSRFPTTWLISARAQLALAAVRVSATMLIIYMHTRDGMARKFTCVPLRTPFFMFNSKYDAWQLGSEFQSVKLPTVALPRSRPS